MTRQIYKANQVLIHHFEKIKNKNKSYSLRALARDMGVPASRAVDWYHNKRAISYRTAKKIAENLKLTDTDKSLLVESAAFDKLERKRIRQFQNDYLEIGSEDLEKINDWYYFAFMALVTTVDFKNDINFISKRLNISRETVLVMLENLKETGLIIISNNQIILKHDKIRTTSDLPSKKLRESHKQSIAQALNSLENDPVELRDITAITFALNINKLSEIKKEIQKFRRLLVKKYSEGDKNQVYNLNLQLFPLTKE